MAKVVHFELPADDPDRAIAFYEGAFGWKIDKWGGPMDYWLVGAGSPDEPGINGAIVRRGDISAPQITIGVASIDEQVERIVAAGGKILMPKVPIPGVGYHALCEDPEGNHIGILQSDPTAQ